MPLDRICSSIGYLRAILNGVGPGWRHLIDEMLEIGTLVRAGPESFTSERGSFCSIMPQAANRRGAETFLDWTYGVD